MWQPEFNRTYKSLGLEHQNIICKHMNDLSEKRPMSWAVQWVLTKLEINATVRVRTKQCTNFVQILKLKI